MFQPTADQVAPGRSVATSFTLSLDDQHGGVATDSNSSLVATSRDLVDDFSGTGRSGIVLQNTGGQIWQWLMNGSQTLSATEIGDPGSAWHVVGTGDFSGDGKADVLMQNTSGQIWELLMNGSKVIGSNNVINPGPAWHVVETGDFNGDGKADILINNANGQVWEYQVSGSTVVASGNAGSPGPSWHVVGAGDLNGDGKSDIVLQNDNGLVTDWLMKGNESRLRQYRQPRLVMACRRDGRFQRRRQVGHLVAGRQWPGAGMADERRTDHRNQ